MTIKILFIYFSLDNLSVMLADYLATKFMSSGGVDIVRPSARSDVHLAIALSTSFFRIQIHHEKIDLEYKISENMESDLYKYINSLNDTKFKHWKQKTVAELIQIFDENQIITWIITKVSR